MTNATTITLPEFTAAIMALPGEDFRVGSFGKVLVYGRTRAELDAEWKRVVFDHARTIARGADRKLRTLKHYGRKVWTTEDGFFCAGVELVLTEQEMGWRRAGLDPKRAIELGR